MSRAFRAVITAGGRVDDAFARELGTPFKALAPLGERRSIDVAIDAAREAGAESIAIVAPSEVVAHCASRVDRTIAADDDGRVNVRRALSASEGSSLLYLTCDLPFVDGRSLRDFLARSSGAAVAMPLAEAAAYQARFAGAPEHVMSLGGERFANGSVFFIEAAAVAPLVGIAERFFSARKNALAMAMLLGPSLLVQYALRRLTLGDVERRARCVLGVDGRAIRNCAPELCYDIDTPGEYRYALANGAH